ncbi:MAG: hypothetical protein EBX52_10460 [Proteobacteria bacterium]|nr:hypothetical protein [Pseudomonadota bacterium]
MQVLVFSARILLMVVVFSGHALAGTAHCWCKSYKTNSASGVLKDYSGDINKVYEGLFPQSKQNQDDCLGRCGSKADQVRNDPSTAAFYCSLGFTGPVTFTFAANVGTRDPETAKWLHLTIEPPSYSCPNGGTLEGNQCKILQDATLTCPAGWLSNSSNQPGGVTTDGICKKILPGCTLPGPAPSSAVFFGNNYGFTSGSSIAIVGNANNGGAAVPSCQSGFSFSGGKCVKTYAATVTSPGVCQWQ